jgi:hypothetical protein
MKRNALSMIELQAHSPVSLFLGFDIDMTAL